MQLHCQQHTGRMGGCAIAAQVDIVLSNCVVNLSPDKARVLAEACRVLRPGGEFYFSDVYSDRRVSAEAQQDEVMPASGPSPSRLLWSLPLTSRSVLRYAVPTCEQSKTLLFCWSPPVNVGSDLGGGFAGKSLPCRSCVAARNACSAQVLTRTALNAKQSKLPHHWMLPSQMLWGECISGALYVNDFLALARSVGFADPRELHVRPPATSLCA